MSTSQGKYINRLFDAQLDFALKSKGAVVVAGPRWCGKTTTATRFAKTVIDLMPLDTRNAYIQLAKIAPHEFLNMGSKPIMVDEWQHVSFIWDQVKYEVDQANEFGCFILAGSAKDNEKASGDSRHTGNGRITRKMMRTLSLFESGESNGIVSLSDLKKGVFKPCVSNANINDYAFYICRGGWPKAIGVDRDAALRQVIDYHEAIVTDDIFSLNDIHLRRDEQKARRVMCSYARYISSSAADRTLLEDVVGEDNDSFDKDAFSKYIQALRALYVIEELPAWKPNLRSKTIIRTKATRHFVDPSIAVATLGLSPEGLFRDIITFESLFESLAIRDLRIYCDAIDAKLYKYRDSKRREADAVIQFRNGSWALVEVKLGNGEDIASASNHLLKIANDIDRERTGNPAFLMVVTKDKVAYQDQNGVYIVPLACLKP